MELNLKRFKETVQQEEIMYLATSKNDDVTIRPVSPLLIGDDMTVYFYTGKYSQKYEQMKENPKAAFSLGASGCYQAQGTVRILGSVFSKENEHINEAYKLKYKGAFEIAAPGEDMESNEFVAVDIKVLKGWIFDENNPEIPIGMGTENF